MVGYSRIKNAARTFAVAFSFFLYAAAFEPWGVAEFAYVFAIPAILAARSMFSGIPAPRSPERIILRRRRPGAALNGEEIHDTADNAEGAGYCKEGNCGASNLKNAKKYAKVWLTSTFAFSYIAWIAMLIWLRHVYPPAGWIIVAVLPLIVS